MNNVNKEDLERLLIDAYIVLRREKDRRSILIKELLNKLIK